MGCGRCVEVCPTQAIEMSGKYMTVHEAASSAERDSPFYRNSGGGVTVSGGEPTMQAVFVVSLMEALKGRKLHLALDTCGPAPWVDLDRLVNYADLVLFDIKHMDSEEHRRGTGAGNEQILSNAEKTARKARKWLRLPLIGGYNDSEENISRVAELGKRIGAEKLSLLPYHRWGEAKYEQLGLRYSWQG
jgi:pyruvate formate lyase activating enzyme